MKCRKWSAKSIEKYLLGLLEEDKKDLIEQHLLICDDCLQAVEASEKSLSPVTATLRLEKEEVFADYAKRETGLKRAGGFRVGRSMLTRLEWRQASWLYASAAILVLLAVLLVSDQVNRDPVESLWFDKQVPYESSSILMRSRGDTAGQDSLVGAFETRFLDALSFYNKHEYGEAVRRFGALRKGTRSVPDSSSISEIVTMLRDFHFFYGLSQLGFARSKQNQLDENNRKKFLLGALDEFRTVSSQDSARADKSYFIGITYGFLSEPDSAVKYLQTIDSSSQFYEKAKNLIKVWSSKQPDK